MQLHRERGSRVRPAAEDVISRALAREAQAEFKRRGMRPGDLAPLLGVSRRRAYEISGWLRGCGPDLRLEAVLRITEGLGLSPVVTVQRQSEAA